MAIQISNFTQACGNIIFQNKKDAVFVDQFANHMQSFSNKSWGVTLDTCMKFCGPDELQQVTPFYDVANGFTNSLLPWLALIAQLPYEGATWEDDVMSAVLAIGSPALITYSLMITILNASWIRTRFKSLDRKKEHEEMPDDMQYVLQAAQQVPIEVHLPGLSREIESDSGRRFWKDVKCRLQNSQRSLTYALAAQIGAASIAYILLLVSAFAKSLGRIDMSFQLASNSLWIWMIPVIAGYILVGTQNRAGTINAAFRDSKYVRAPTEPDPAIAVGSQAAQRRRSHSFSSLGARDKRPNVARSTNRADPSQSCIAEQDAEMSSTIASPTSASPITNRNVEKCEPDTAPAERATNTLPEEQDVDTCPGKAATVAAIKPQEAGPQNNEPKDFFEYKTRYLGFSIAGDNETEGPIYNYARIFTWNSIVEDFVEIIGLQSTGKEGTGPQSKRKEGTTSSQPEERGITNSRKDFYPYPEWNKIDPDLWHNVFRASLVAVWIQWGTAGAATMIAYLTPPHGLDCRAGSHLLYGVAGTSVWLLLCASMLISHAAMLREQHRFLNNDSHLPTSIVHTALAAAAIALRLLGKALALANALWLVASSFFELVGLYDSCWCMGATLSHRGGDAWVLLFASAQDLAAASLRFWVGGVFFSLAVCVLAGIMFYLECSS